MNSLLALIISSLITLNTLALVDYSDPADDAPEPAKAVSSPATTSKATVTRTGPARKNTQPYLEFKSSFFGHEYENTGRKVNALGLEARIETDYDIFLSLEHAFYSGKNSSDKAAVNNESGNTQAILGIHWLEFGQPSNALNFDIYGGARLKSKGEFASSRNDKIVGVETSKRFYNVALALGYDYTMTGSPADASEKDIGNISALSAKLGILVSSDIKFLFSAKNITIASSSADNSENHLKSTIKYAYLKPELILSLSQSVGLTLGGVFQTRRPKQDELTSDLRLWSLTGLYGNSIFAGLDFSI